MGRVRILIKGVVQGVGFRPFVYNLAKRRDIRGFCQNTSDGVVIEAEGDCMDGFIAEIQASAPPLSRIDSLTAKAVPTDPGAPYTGFTIRESQKEEGKFALVSPDVATCDDCLREMKDPLNRRHGYPFINCTNCGPRYSIILDIPYDRPSTTMARFKMCGQCEAEYNDPADRRFHAQPNACGVCGPRVWLVKKGDSPGNAYARGSDAIELVKDFLREGAVVAIKGLGGFHIACDAANDKAVKRLRERKRKSNKPFALMSPDIPSVRGYARTDGKEEDILSGRIRPIVILEKRGPESLVSEHVAPSTSTFGVMLPYTPLHHLVLDGFAALVMTSGNVADEPIVISNEEAVEKLSFAADFFLLHDRDIYMRVDDSIVRLKKDTGKTMVLRRARGYTPGVVDCGAEMGSVFASGAELKNTFALTKGRYSILSQHMGDVTNLESLDFCRETIKNLRNTFRVRPRIVAYDMHPDYLSTALAMECKENEDIPDLNAVAVQHHHAHIVSAMAEHGLDNDVIGVSFDGTGYGADGRVWGGEFIIASRAGFSRIAHLKYVPMPGADAAVRQPWRMATSYLYSALGEGFPHLAPFFVERIGRDRIQLVTKMIQEGINSPLTSSAGRLFDAVSSILGITDVSTFEAEAAIALEKAALDTAGVYPFEVADGGVMEIDTAPLIRAIVQDMKKGRPGGVISAVFHNTTVEIIAETVKRLRDATSIDTVVLSGGVFQNFRLLTGAVKRLAEDGMRVFHNEQIPINDGGIALGQAAVAWERVRERVKGRGIES
ncbi:MAG: carbamoyltransferase HypF [Deltaproteobacteria bacterium]|nr:carbamoyltransferase HypF [Deltaproteobacteria bacterium]